MGKKRPKYIFLLKKYNMVNIPKLQKELIMSKKKDILMKQGKELLLSFKLDWHNNKIKTDTQPIGIDTEAGKEFVKLKEEMFAEGILSFDDAYDLAFRYIREQRLRFNDFSDKRFQYLFIDEVQDCDNRQIALVNQLFADDKVIIQRFGDYCQAIYEETRNEVVDNNELKGENVLYIHDSNRFGENIAKPLRSLCMEDNHLLQGSKEVPSLKPVIITYENPEDVLPRYVTLLGSTKIPELNNLSVLEIANQKRNEDPLHRVNVKACGWVGKKGACDRKRLIESYFPAFKRNNVKQRIEGNSFEDFIYKCSDGNVKSCATSIIQGVLKVLDLCGAKNDNRRHTRTSMLNFLSGHDIELKDNFLQMVMQWSLLISKCQGKNDIHKLKEAIHKYIESVLLPVFEKTISQEAINFFNAPNVDVHTEQGVENGNIFNGNGIEIEVATIHSVKGETHVSTLYLETFYQKLHESERLAQQFKGVMYTGDDKRTLSALKVAYVGMSRPRYFLCVAMQKDRFQKMDCPELRDIWNVVEA